MDLQTSKLNTTACFVWQAARHRVHKAVHRATKAGQDQPHYSICSVTIIQQKRKAGKCAMENYDKVW